MDPFKQSIRQVAESDIEGVVEARNHYGDSWRAEGGFSAWFNIKRKIDRLTKLLGRETKIVDTPKDPLLIKMIRERYNLFSQIESDLLIGGETTLDTIRDLRRYLMLAEAWLVEQGIQLPLSRDNLSAREKIVAERVDQRIVRIKLPISEAVTIFPGDIVEFDPSPFVAANVVTDGGVQVVLDRRPDEDMLKAQSDGRYIGLERNGPRGFQPSVDIADGTIQVQV